MGPPPFSSFHKVADEMPVATVVFVAILATVNLHFPETRAHGPEFILTVDPETRFHGPALYTIGGPETRFHGPEFGSTGETHDSRMICKTSLPTVIILMVPASSEKRFHDPESVNLPIQSNFTGDVGRRVRSMLGKNLYVTFADYRKGPIWKADPHFSYKEKYVI